MAKHTVAVKRPYDSSRRRAAAELRRAAVVDAAAALFRECGFRATTIAAIAQRAGVSADSVFKHFGTKAALAKAVFDVTLAGDHAPHAVPDRPEAQAIRDEPDLDRKLAMFVEGLAERQARSAFVQILIRDGRHVDDSLEALWREINREAEVGMGLIATHLVDSGLVAAQKRDAVRDVLCNYVAIDSYERLVLERGWSHQRYASFLEGAVRAAVRGLTTATESS